MAHSVCAIFFWRAANWYSLPPLISSLHQLKNTVSTVEIKLEEYITEAQANELAKTYDLILCLDSFQSTEAMKIAEKMRKRNTAPFSDFVYVAGGPHPSGDLRGTLEMGYDYVVVGEGEDALKDLVSVLSTDKKPKIVPEGVGRLKASGKIDFTPRKQRVNLDDYQPFVTQPKNLHPPIEIARGCPFGCKFCQVSYLFGYKPYYRSLAAIERIANHYCNHFQKKTQLRFIAPNFLGYGSKTGRKPNLHALTELIRTIKSFDVDLYAGTFPSTVRPDFINKDTARLLSENVANKRISMGVQSGSPKILANICGRGHSLQSVIDAHEHLENFNLKSSPDFILGIPGEQRSDQWQTIEFMKSLIEQFDAKPRIHYFIPLPGTPLGDQEPSLIDGEAWKEICELTRKKLAEGHFSKQKRLVKDLFRPATEIMPIQSG
ncbi:MAG: TIGR04013 family B12-binding domain/radical SAM domain-containing protein [Candidatus Thorarchaeota archaeon]